ncbi:hypothetical protein AT268_33375 [Bacillus cereus]|uniref:Uncharacterized protein n=1 Tax=Bacillus cereus TaxID=1396 RepID=A0A9X0MKF8_BACCE|nr:MULTISPECIES: hypothetical protein [Bacillus cereus group]KXY51369.1 hypothetical protein AT268_33375 [Bacillus cereus]PEZ74923.1 hypothetical protein CN410_12380 [Bacillus anthracis]PFA29707.1 hypothetical protein CN384_08495 [Bacillus thuringiensis]PGW13353.1 hypothetical protein COD97_08275 [Bacillus cereus]
MIETLLIKFYKQKLSNYALAYKHVLINIIIVGIIIFLSVLIPAPYIIYNNQDFLLLSTFFFISLIISIMSLILLINLPAINFTRRFYKIKLHSTEWELFRLFLLKEYLVENKFIDTENKNTKENKEKIEMLISLFQQKLDNRQKNKPFAILGSYFNTSIVFLIPIWAAFNNQVYFKEVTLNEALHNIGTILAVLLFLFVLFCMIKIFKIQYNFLYLDYKLQEIIYMLSQLQIIHNNDKFSQKHISQDQKDKIKTMIKDYNKTRNNQKEKNTTSFLKRYSYFKWK